MAVPDPNVLNRFVLFNPAVARVLGAAITAVSVGLSLVIARYFFKSYSFSGLGYLLGLPAGFAFLGASFLFEMTSLLYSADLVLHPAFFWIQMSV
jgi:hypothetical protein